MNKKTVFGNIVATIFCFACDLNESQVAENIQIDYESDSKVKLSDLHAKKIMTVKQLHFILLTITITLLSSCISKEKKGNYEQTILIDTKKQEIKLSEIVSQIRIIPLDETDDVIGHIKDVCAIDGAIYLLDDITASILAFDLNTGRFIKRVCHRGAGPNEYIAPTALSSNAENLYALDMPANRIICYDRQMRPTGTVSFSIPAMDFIAVQNGFYLYSPGRFKHDKVVFIDRKGQTIDSYLPVPEPETKTNGDEYAAGAGKYFTKACDGDVYFSESFKNIVYRFHDRKLASFTFLDFGKDSPPPDFDNYRLPLEESVALGAGFFEQETCTVVSFLKQDLRYYSFRERSSGKLLTGIVRDGQNNIPFFPQWRLDGQTVIGCCQYQDLKANWNSVKKYAIADIDENNLTDETTLLLLFSVKDSFTVKPHETSQSNRDQTD